MRLTRLERNALIAGASAPGLILLGAIAYFSLEAALGLVLLLASILGWALCMEKLTRYYHPSNRAERELDKE